MNKNLSSIRINLSGKPKEKVESLFLKWAINSGKVIIIITELVALGALGYRFVVDKQIVDLHDSIAQKEQFIKAQETKEKEYRGIQDRLTLIKTITTEAHAKLDLLNTLLEAQNSQAYTATNLTISQDTVILNGTSTSIFSLNSLITSLKSNPNIQEISIENITTNESGIQFKMNIQLNKSTLNKPKA